MEDPLCSRMSALSVPKITYSADPYNTRSRTSQGVFTRSSHWTERSTVARSHSSSAASRNTSAKSLFINPFGFDAKTSYDATETLLQCRSDGFQLPETQPDDDIWKRPPPDFRPQCFAPKPPKRNTRDAMQPWKYGTIPGKRDASGSPRQKKRVILPSLLEPPEKEKPRFITEGFDIPDPDGARLLFAKEGMYRPGPFQDAKLHDFRGYPPLKSLGLDEFEVPNEHDPYNIYFKTNNLDIIHGLPKGVATDRDTSGQQMAPPLPIPPQWEARLILPQSPWPKLSGEYTRYPKVGRSPHSAMMERIEDKLSSDWAKEKLKQAIKQRT